MRVRRAEPAEARKQAGWIAAIEPWRSLGYSEKGLARWLGRSARDGRVMVGVEARAIQAVVVLQPDVLLGDFIALLAVRPEAAGGGRGRALVEKVEARTFRRRRWLYVSSDATNTAAARFYRRVGFVRVARLPGLVRAGRVEILWRKGRDQRLAATR
jgi:ribosomal protein S18 acetylase RimI-like enzyme